MPWFEFLLIVVRGSRLNKECQIEIFCVHVTSKDGFGSTYRVLGDRGWGRPLWPGGWRSRRRSCWRGRREQSCQSSLFQRGKPEVPHWSCPQTGWRPYWRGLGGWRPSTWLQDRWLPTRLPQEFGRHAKTFPDSLGPLCRRRYYNIVNGASWLTWPRWLHVFFNPNGPYIVQMYGHVRLPDNLKT